MIKAQPIEPEEKVSGWGEINFVFYKFITNVFYRIL
jgi:hypothetical protein